MLRILLIAGGFLSVTLALVLLQPGKPSTERQAAQSAPVIDDRDDGDAVTRAATDLDALVSAATMAQATPPAPAAEPAAVAPDISSLTRAVQQAQGGSGDSDLQDMTNGILAELGETGGSGDADALQALTKGVLANLQAKADASGEDLNLETLIVQALQQGQSDSYIDALLNEAATTGSVAVPQALVTSDGRVDTRTLLASIVQKSAGTGTGDTAALAAAADPAPKRLAKPEIYVVQPGDSLAAISYRFYGETMNYTDIFSANRDKIASPDKIRVGQRLTIPVL